MSDTIQRALNYRLSTGDIARRIQISANEIASAWANSPSEKDVPDEFRAEYERLTDAVYDAAKGLNELGKRMK